MHGCATDRWQLLKIQGQNRLEDVDWDKSYAWLCKPTERYMAAALQGQNIEDVDRDKPCPWLCNRDMAAGLQGHRTQRIIM